MAESKKLYRLSAVNLNELNLLLSQLGERLDSMEGYRGNPTFQAGSTVKYVDSNGTVIHSFGGTDET